MKPLLTIVTLLAVMAFFSASTPAAESTDEIKFFNGSWKEALVKAKKEKKVIFLDIYATWCGPCKKLKKQTFVDKNVAKFYNANFINVSLDGEKGDGAVLAQKYQIPGYPSLLIIDTGENPLYATAGFLPPGAFLNFGKEGLKKAKKLN